MYIKTDGLSCNHHEAKNTIYTFFKDNSSDNSILIYLKVIVTQDIYLGFNFNVRKKYKEVKIKAMCCFA